MLRLLGTQLVSPCCSHGPWLKPHPEAFELSMGTGGGMAAGMADSTRFGKNATLVGVASLLVEMGPCPLGRSPACLSLPYSCCISRERGFLIKPEGFTSCRCEFTPVPQLRGLSLS